MDASSSRRRASRRVAVAVVRGMLTFVFATGQSQLASYALAYGSVRG
jgi:hypothetical protein